MLKVKEGLDFKELENFRFYKGIFQGQNVYQRVNPLVGSIGLISTDNYNNPPLLILTDRGYQPHHDYKYQCTNDEVVEDYFSDLIEAGLVEKVNE